MIADTRSVTTCNVAIRQIFSYRTMSIRDRTIIKVTAQNNTLFFMLLNVLLPQPQASGARFFCCLGKFYNEQFGRFFCSISTCNFPITRFLNWRLSSKLKPVVSK